LINLLFCALATSPCAAVCIPRAKARKPHFTGIASRKSVRDAARQPLWLTLRRVIRGIDLSQHTVLAVLAFMTRGLGTGLGELRTFRIVVNPPGTERDRITLKSNVFKETNYAGYADTVGGRYSSIPCSRIMGTNCTSGSGQGHTR
jgi:hypothetical protein